MSKNSRTSSIESFKEYLAARDRLYKSIKIRLGDIAISVGHNSATNSKETTSAFVNQVHSVSEILEAGFGLELDLHWNEETQEIDVCHSTSVGCLDPLLDRTPLRDVVTKISDFIKENPDRFVFIDFEDTKLAGKITKANVEENAKMLLSLFNSKFESVEDFKEFLTNIFTAGRDKPYCFGISGTNNVIKQRNNTNQDSYSPRQDIRDHIDSYYSQLWNFATLLKDEYGIEEESTLASRNSVEFRRNFLEHVNSEKHCTKKDHDVDPMDFYKCLAQEEDKKNKMREAVDFFLNLPRNWHEACHITTKSIQDAEISSENSVIISYESSYGIGLADVALNDEFIKQVIAQVHAIGFGTKEDSVIVPNLLSNRYANEGIEMASRLTLDQDLCDYFKRASSPESNYGLTTSFDTALGAPFYNTYSEEVIGKLLECGVKVFKFDYVVGGESCDARLLQIDEFNFLKILDRDDLQEEAKETCRELLAANHKFSQTAKYPFPINSAILAPLVGKPLAQLETLFAAAKYWSGIDTDRYEAMILSAEDKYKYHNPLWSFVSSASMGALREAIPALESNGINKYVSWGLKAAISATDLYLYSQSVLPLGISMLVATTAEKLGCNSTAVTALKYGCNTLVNYALDPGASLLDVAVNSGLSIAGAAAGSYCVKLIDRAYKNYHKASGDLDCEQPGDPEFCSASKLSEESQKLRRR